MTVQNQFGTGFGEYSSKVSRIGEAAASRYGNGLGRVVNKHDPTQGRICQRTEEPLKSLQLRPAYCP
jgi:hypothetical protein